jgi:hypothetical protein
MPTTLPNNQITQLESRTDEKCEVTHAELVAKDERFAPEVAWLNSLSEDEYRTEERKLVRRVRRVLRTPVRPTVWCLNWGWWWYCD